MRDLLTDPLWQPTDLGKPLPDSLHAVSVCLPTWADNVGYEEGDPRVVDAMRCGYPRFFYHPRCRELFAAGREKFGRPGEACLAFGSQSSAEQFQQFLRSQSDAGGRIVPWGSHDVHLVHFPESTAPVAKLGWQHLGGGATSRQADAALTNREVPDASEAKRAIRERIAKLTGIDADDIYLFPCGMNAMYGIHRMLQTESPDRSVQFGFPYVDTLKILEKVGPGSHFFPRGDAADLAALKQTIANEPVSGLYTEFPSNPLLRSPDLKKLAEIAHEAGCPLVVDETIAGFHNVDLRPVADVIFSSLTKFFSGIGDVTAGVVLLNQEQSYYEKLKPAMEAVYVDSLYAEDAIVLERNSRDYGDRIPRINESAEKLTSHLAERPEVESVFYPGLNDTELYDCYRKPAGGYSGLFSLVLKNPAETTSRFFDRLRINKGPNLGTNFTLACPFTLLAHYNELDFAESCDVSRWLVRVSVGLEDADDLIARFDEALTSE